MYQSNAELRQLQVGDRVTGLKLGDARFTPLKTFLSKQAKKFHESDLGKTYVLDNESKIIAYVTLVSGEISTDIELIDKNIDYAYKSYPAVKIARLAVDHRFSGMGLGRKLVEFSLGLVKTTICRAIGCRFVVVDAKTTSVEFYRKCGFTMLGTEENRRRDTPLMFVDLHKIEI